MTAPFRRVRLAKTGITFFSCFAPVPSLDDDRRNHEGLSLPEFRSSNEKPLWRCTRVSAPSFRESCPKCLFASPVSKPTRTLWQTRKPGRLPWATSSSVRFSHLLPSRFLAVRLDKLSHPYLTSKTAGLGAGITEAVAVVCPMEVVKIRLQAQMHSLADPQEVPQYRNAGHAVYKIIREEGFKALYRGVSLTALRQATNQGAVCPKCILNTVWLTG